MSSSFTQSSALAGEGNPHGGKPRNGKPRGGKALDTGENSFAARIQEFQTLHETDTGDFKRKALSCLNRLQEELQPVLNKPAAHFQALLEEAKEFLICAEIYPLTERSQYDSGPAENPPPNKPPAPQAPEPPDRARAAAAPTMQASDPAGFAAGEETDRARAAAVEELREQFLSRLREIQAVCGGGSDLI